MILHIVPYYAAALALLFIGLSANVIRGRRSRGVAVGTGGDGTLERRIRAHANFAEYTPFALLLVAMVEIRGAPVLCLHVLGSCLFLGRLSHAWAFSQPREDFRFRVAGIVATFACIVGAALLLLLP